MLMSQKFRDWMFLHVRRSNNYKSARAEERDSSRAFRTVRISWSCFGKACVCCCPSITLREPNLTHVASPQMSALAMAVELSDFAQLAPLSWYQNRSFGIKCEVSQASRKWPAEHPNAASEEIRNPKPEGRAQ